jgi:branched-chain amino acid transport system substrate-binding protein
MNKIIFAICLILLSIIIILAIRYDFDKPPIKVGFIAGLSGKTSELGVSERAGALHAVEEINEAGGLKGRLLELIIKDDHNDPETALKGDRELIREGVVAIIGHATSTMSSAAVHLINQEKILMIAPTASTTKLSGIDDYFIRITPVSDAEMSALAKVAINKLGLKSVAVIYDLSNKGLTETNLENFQTSYELLQGKVSAKIPFISGKTNEFSKLIQKTLGSNSDGIFLLAGSIDAALICQQVRKLNSDIPIITIGWATTSDLIQHGGKAVEDLKFVQVIDINSQNPKFQKFAKQLKKKFQREPNFGAMYAYQAVYMLYEAMKHAPNLNSETLKNYIIKRKSFPGLQNDVVIDEFGDSQGNFMLFTIKNGKFIKEN